LQLKKLSDYACFWILIETSVVKEVLNSRLELLANWSLAECSLQDSPTVIFEAKPSRPNTLNPRALSRAAANAGANVDFRLSLRHANAEKELVEQWLADAESTRGWSLECVKIDRLPGGFVRKKGRSEAIDTNVFNVSPYGVRGRDFEPRSNLFQWLQTPCKPTTWTCWIKSLALLANPLFEEE
jgi:hypothetical protein